MFTILLAAFSAAGILLIGFWFGQDSERRRWIKRARQPETGRTVTIDRDIFVVLPFPEYHQLRQEAERRWWRSQTLEEPTTLLKFPPRNNKN